MIRTSSVLGVALAMFVTNDAFINRASYGLFFYVSLSCVAYGGTRNLEFSQGRISPIFKSTIGADRARRNIELPEAKLELALILNSDISDYIDTNYAEIEFCRLFSEVQEIFGERNITIEFSALQYEEKTEITKDLNETIYDDGILDVSETISNLTGEVENWEQEYDAYLFLTRQRIVENYENTSTIYKSGYSIVGGACRPGSNVAIATYSLKHIVHQITHLLGAIHSEDDMWLPCREVNYTEEIVGDDNVPRTKGLSKCTNQLMKDFLNTTSASCIYSEDVTESIDCENIIPEIRLDDTLNLYDILNTSVSP